MNESRERIASALERIANALESRSEAAPRPVPASTGILGARKGPYELKWLLMSQKKSVRYTPGIAAMKNDKGEQLFPTKEKYCQALCEGTIAETEETSGTELPPVELPPDGELY